MRASSFFAFATVTVVAAAIGYFVGRPPGVTASTLTPAVRGEKKVRLYQSPMHPWITSDQPGKCTICGMNLVPVYEGETASVDPSTVALSANTAAVIGVQTTAAIEQELTRTLRVNGVFQTDHTRHRILSARVPGRIEVLHVDQVGQAVVVGDPLITLYSPEMLTAQRLFLERINAGPGVYSASQLADTRERLLDLGATEDDVANLTATRTPKADVIVRAPFSGTVISRGPSAYAGAYVDASANLFEIADLSVLWFVFDAYEADLTSLHLGDSVRITPAGNAAPSITEPLAFIDPNLDPITRTAPARVVVSNPEGKLRHGQTATAEVKLNLGRALTVPRSAVLFTRDQPMVFLALTGQTYRPTTVQLGRRGDDGFEITSGLEPNNRVVTSAALILEGQAQLSAPAPSTSMAMSPKSVPIEDDIASLEPLILVTADAADALAQDDLNRYAAQLPAITAAWKNYTQVAPDAATGPLANLVGALSGGPNIEAARAAFEPFSTEIADLALSAGLNHTAQIHVFQCPMTPVLGRGRWVQRGPELRNPFFGSDMLTCGSAIK